MPFKVFLTYSLEPADQALAWRLQTLAASSGIEMYVPRREGGVATLPGMTIQGAIDRSDCLLAIITAKVNASVQTELKYALQRNKLVVPIVQSDFATHPLLAKFRPVFTFSPGDNPGKLEGEVAEFLTAQKLEKEKRQAIGGLVAVGLGLLVLRALSEK